jgi:gamma-glutamyltranspeptidase/glutathione hydrolase
MKLMAAICAVLLSGSAMGSDFSPASWPNENRQKAEQAEWLSWAPLTNSVRSGEEGVVAATVSPVAVEAGVQMLRKGGTAADAAASIALTQVTTQLGSVVSYAGIMTLVYFDARSGKVWSLDAGYGTYRGETDPASIPTSDISALTGGVPPAPGPGLGRQTLVPGFMAGVEAMQKRFGRYGLREALQPAIWYAENGIKISAPLAYFFTARQKQLMRTPEGRAFLGQAGNTLPQSGDNFRQNALAETLRTVANDGARTMYTGAWAKAFVAQVQRDGGKVSLADLASYRPVWSEAASTKVFDHTVYTNGGTSFAPYQILTALNAAEALGVSQRGPYWRDPETFLMLNRLGEVVAGAPQLVPAVADALKARGVDISPAGQRSKAYAQALATALPALTSAATGDTHHSNALVVVDKRGNIAVMTHTINAVIWGGTGIVVGGIPIPDSAGFQQARLATLNPGDRLPNEIADALVIDSRGHPVLASGVIGSSMLPETLRVIVSHIAQKQPLAEVAAAPPLLILTDSKSYLLPLSQRPVILPANAYEPSFVAALRAKGLTVVDTPAAAVTGVRGTVALIGLDGTRKTVPETSGIMVFSGTE